MGLYTCSLLRVCSSIAQEAHATHRKAYVVASAATCIEWDAEDAEDAGKGCGEEGEE